jgi:hypothetical protein
VVAPHENVRQHFGQFLSPPHCDPRRSLCQSISVSRRDSRQTVGQGGTNDVREEVKCRLHVAPLDRGRGGGGDGGRGSGLPKGAGGGIFGGRVEACQRQSEGGPKGGRGRDGGCGDRKRGRGNVGEDLDLFGLAGAFFVGDVARRGKSKSCRFVCDGDSDGGGEEGVGGGCAGRHGSGGGAGVKAEREDSCPGSPRGLV